MAEKFVWKQTLENRNEFIKEVQKLRDKERHARYYQEHREAILKKQKKRDELRDRKTYSRDYYLAHREEKLAKNRFYYQRRKGRKIMNNKERISALLLNIKNWSWDVYPKFFIEKEDADALRDLEALKQYIAEVESYGKK